MRTIPLKISNAAMIRVGVSASPKTTTPITNAPIAPMPVQIEYAVPSGSVFIAMERNAKLASTSERSFALLARPKRPFSDRAALTCYFFTAYMKFPTIMMGDDRAVSWGLFGESLCERSLRGHCGPWQTLICGCAITRIGASFANG